MNRFHVAWQAGTTTLFEVLSLKSLESISGLLKSLQIRVQVSSTFDSTVKNPFLAFTLAKALAR
jgi:hypothetical protein